MRVLLVQTSFLGDTILSTPVIGALKARFPDWEIWTLTTPLARQLLQRDPGIYQTLVFDKRGKYSGLFGLWRLAAEIRAHKFDRAYVLHRSWRTALLMWFARIPLRIGFSDARLRFLYHEQRDRHSGTQHDVERNLAILKRDELPSNFDPRIRLFPPDRNELSEEAQKNFPAPQSYVALVPGSVWPTKRWDSQRYRELVQALEGRGERLVLLGAPEEREISEAVALGTNALNLCGRTSLSELLYLIRHSKGIVCNDSMALHVASAFQVPCVAVFCATSPRFGFGPWGNPAALVVERSDLPCKPCSRHGTKRCPLGTNACMQGLEMPQVLRALDRVLPQPH